MIKDDDLFALAEAVLESPNPSWAELVRQIRNEDYCCLRDGVATARFALRKLAERSHPGAQELLDRLP